MTAPIADIEAVRQGDPAGAARGRRSHRRAGRGRVAAAGLVARRGAHASGAQRRRRARDRARPRRAARSACSIPGGAEQRAAGIAAGRGVGAAALLADLRRSCDALMEVVDAAARRRVGARRRARSPAQRTQRGWVWSRWREVEVHHVDLGLGYSPSEWPVAFVTRGLDEAFAELPDRADRGALPGDASFRVEATDHDRAWVVHDRRATRSTSSATTAPSCPSTAPSPVGAATCSPGSTAATPAAPASPRRRPHRPPPPRMVPRSLTLNHPTRARNSQPRVRPPTLEYVAVKGCGGRGPCRPCRRGSCRSPGPWPSARSLAPMPPG